MTFDKKKPKDITKPVANSFMVYRRLFNKWLEKSDLKISNQQIVSSLVSKLWSSEPLEVKQYYKNISDKRRKLHKERLMQYIPDDVNDILAKRKQTPSDDNDDIDKISEIVTNSKRQRSAE